MGVCEKLGIKLNKEQQLLVNSLPLIVNHGQVAEIEKILKQKLDWDYWLDLVKYHGIAPLIYCSFKRNIPELIPPDVLSNLENYYRQNAVSNLALSHELIKITNILKSHNIKAIPYKGPVLAEYLYQDIALRCSADIDLIVSESDVYKVKDILVKAHYKFPCVANNHLKLNPPLEWQSEYLMTTDNQKILIDIHQKITANDFFCPLSMSYIWEKLTEINFLNQELPFLDKNKLFLILATHGTKHCWELLSWLCDLATLITIQKDIDFEKILFIAEQISQYRIVLLTFSLCQKLFLIQIPAQIQDKINQDPEINKLTSKSIHNIFNSKFNWEEKSFEDRFFDKFWFYLQLQNTYQGKFQQVLSMIKFLISPNLRDWYFYPLPPKYYLFYYFIRPFRLTSKSIFKS